MLFKKLSTAFAGGLLAASLTLMPAASAASAPPAADAASDTSILNEVLQYIEAYNLTGAERSELIRAAIDGMVYALDDPYSQYFSKQESEEYVNAVDLEYVGIGVSLQYTGKELYIEEVQKDSPAESAGLKRGDVILKINGVPIADLKGDELNGKAGTTLTLLIKRGTATKSVAVTRKDIASASVTGRLIGPKIAYISLKGFTETSGDEFAKVLAAMRAGGMKSMVLDLRDNTGGYLDAAYSIASQFIDKGIMMYTSDQSGALTPVTITDGSKINVPVVVLTNEYTASASEALTGALRDNKLATIVGTRTYGKARIQSLLNLSNGDMLKLTTQRYLTPNKEDFNHIGLAPDLEVAGKAAQLVTAFQIAGMKTMEISGDNHILNINGVPFAGNVGLLKQNGVVYASSRLLAALSESDLRWDAKNKKVLLISGSGKVSGFPVSSKEAVSVNGETYIQMKAFKAKFPAVSWSYNAALNILKLSVK